MAISHKNTLDIVYEELTYHVVATQSGGQENNVSETIPDSSTDLEVTWEADSSAMVSFFMVSDQDILVETNNGTTPDDSFSLLAGVPTYWSASNVGVGNPITTDVTTNIFVTNSSGSDATLIIKMLQDPTP